MTNNEEAIEILKEGQPFSEIYSKDYEEAINHAIEALEFQDKFTDIFAQAVVNAGCDSFEEFVNVVIATINNVPTGECRTCRHRDPEDKKCDCGGLERLGCPFPVSDDYFCKFYEKGGETDEETDK